MSARGGRGHSGCGSGAHAGCRGCSRGSNYTGSTSAPKKGLCTALGANVFDYGTKGTADQMRTSWEKLMQYVGTNYGQDISNELQNKAVITLAKPTHSAAVLARHAVHEMMICTSQMNLQTARQAQLLLLQALVDAGVDPEAPMKLAVLQNEMAQAEFEAAVAVPIDLTNSEKTQWSNDWRTYHERNSQLVKNQGQAFSLIMGQCTQLLQDKMKQDADWEAISMSYNPLLLYHLIEKMVLAQMEDQYPFVTVYEQEMVLYSFQQETLLNPQYYERFNTKVDVTNAIGITQQHKVLLEYIAQDLHQQAFRLWQQQTNKQSILMLRSITCHMCFCDRVQNSTQI